MNDERQSSGSGVGIVIFVLLLLLLLPCVAGIGVFTWRQFAPRNPNPADFNVKQ